MKYDLVIVFEGCFSRGMRVIYCGILSGEEGIDQVVEIDLEVN